ncbi:hypothetical protein Cgig2_027435 [Carnegiea gigantea]|uniref:Uncharacterized protein n=1 Tax=Carnegiea gigantea TaxID=171969 RepID=A0A9Q1Q8V0_9CARY|nr:hypothetical protein Cgig2_027435 [Carnegiea gigantea]
MYWMVMMKWFGKLKGNHEEGALVIDDVHSLDEDYPYCTEEAATNEQLEVTPAEEPTVEESAVEQSTEESAEEVLAVDVSPLEGPAVDIAKPKHPSPQVLPSVDTPIGVPSESVHFTMDVHITNTETSYTDDDSESSDSVEDHSAADTIEARVTAANVVGVDQLLPRDADGDAEPCSMTEAGTAEVESLVEDGSGSWTNEKDVMVSSSSTDAKPTVTVADWYKRRPRTTRAARFQSSPYVIPTNQHRQEMHRKGSSVASPGKRRENGCTNVQDMGDIPPTQEVRP